MTQIKLEHSAFQEALNLLTGRDYSEAELRSRLSRHGYESKAIDDAIARCKEYGYLDTARFAANRARGLFSRGQAVGGRVKEDLRRRGVDAEIIETVMQEMTEEFPAPELLGQILERRFAGFDFRQADMRSKNRVIGYFLRRGFSRDVVLQALYEQSRRKEQS